MSGQPTSSNENFDSVVPSFNGDVISNIEPVGSSLSTANSILAIVANTTSIAASFAQFWATQAEIQRIQEDAKAHRQKAEVEVRAYSQKLDTQSDNLAKSLKALTEDHEVRVQNHNKQIDHRIESQKNLLEYISAQIAENKQKLSPEELSNAKKEYVYALGVLVRIDTSPLPSLDINGIVKDWLSSTSFSDKQARSTGQKSANTVDVDAAEI
jgi:hypothetical protein